MSSTLVQEAWAVEVGSREPWDDDSKLFQPLEETQVQSNERAQSLAVQCFLRLCGLKHVVEQRVNAEFISPTGAMPVLKCGSFILSELDSIVNFVASKSITLSADLSLTEKADLKAYISLVGIRVQVILCNAELYFSWVSPLGYDVTYYRYGSVYPWPLNRILPWRKRRMVKRTLKEWAEKDDVEVFNEIVSCLKALSERLADKPFFFGAQPTELDCLVFGHLFVLLNPSLEAAPGLRQVAPLVSNYPNLVQFCKQIETKYFPDEKL
ncbi:metaxin-2-like [Tropilaelaps mercedesae]|uniref:Metaxin-2-like n=1 Tax=Tropilaelaps mercedesae TaxID=418985 RepID=A0A1V9XY79_9ACAR|nr:metaxin-2-like [Tropilaelaps mercedesae]